MDADFLRAVLPRREEVPEQPPLVAALKELGPIRLPWVHDRVWNTLCMHRLHHPVQYGAKS